jgi:hypothetical protein
VVWTYLAKTPQGTGYYKQAKEPLGFIRGIIFGYLQILPSADQLYYREFII